MAPTAAMEIRLRDAPAGALLVCGVPLAQGVLPAGAALRARDEAQVPVPLWWQVRAGWPDGSAKWVFVHLRPTGTSRVLRLERGEPGDSLAGTEPALEQVGAGTHRLQVGRLRLEMGPTGWTLESPAGRCALRPQPVVTAAGPAALGPGQPELVEASPLGPLVRVRHPRAAGVGLEHLLRLDPGNGCLEWQQRASFLGPDSAVLVRLSAVLEFGGGTWTFVGERAPRRQLVLPQPGLYRADDGPLCPGRPAVALRSDLGGVELVKGWQRAPCAAQVRGATIELEFYPDCVPGLTAQPGTSFRHQVRLALGGSTVPPTRWGLDPERACATGVFGPLAPSSPRIRKLFPGFEQTVEACFQGGRLQRLDKEPGQTPGGPAPLADEQVQDEEYFGLRHYGDWPMRLGAYGGEHRMYADNEYDTPYAYDLQFIRTGDPGLREVAFWSAVHMADVDCKATDGDMRFHGYHQTAEDHAEHRTPGGDLGHYWTDGLILNYLLAGDLWCWEAALAQARLLLDAFDGDGDEPVRRHFLGCERAVGWPLTALAAVAEVSADARILAKMRQMVGFLSRFAADPDRELEEVDTVDGKPLRWWRVGQQDGSKPFMLGVVLEGLERYHRLTGDPAAATAAVAIGRFLVDTMWVPGVEAFIYEWNAFNRGHREDVYPHYINMMVAPGLAFAHELTGDARFRDVATRAFHAALWTLAAPGGGKEIGMVGRTSAQMLGRLHAWLDGDQAARCARQEPSHGVPFAFRGTAADLARLAALRLKEGVPRYAAAGQALLSDGESYQVFAFREPVNTDRGHVEFAFTPRWDCPAHPGPVAQRAYIHLCDRPFTRSCVSVISFYTALHVRFYDAERHYVEVLEASIEDWRAGDQHQVCCSWDVDLGEARLLLDGVERDRRRLSRRLGGAFKRLHVGHRPGNWRSEGLVGPLSLRLG